MVWCGVWCSAVWCGVVWCGVWCGVVCGEVWCGVVCGEVWCDVVRCGVVWCGVVCGEVWWSVWCVVWCGVVWCGVVWCGRTMYVRRISVYTYIRTHVHTYPSTLHDVHYTHTNTRNLPYTRAYRHTRKTPVHTCRHNLGCIIAGYTMYTIHCTMYTVHCTVYAHLYYIIIMIITHCTLVVFIILDITLTVEN